MKQIVPAEKAEVSQLPRLTYSLQEAADTLGVSYLTAWRLNQRGIIGALPGLRHKRIPKAEIERYLASATGK